MSMPTMVTTGSMAFRSTCVRITVRSSAPLARAVRTKSMLSVSIRLCPHEADVHPRDDHRGVRQGRIMWYAQSTAHRSGGLRHAEDLAVARDRRPSQLVANEVREHEADPEGGQGDADQDVDHGRPVEQRSRSERREDAEEDGDGEHEDHRAEDERAGDRRGAQDLLVDRLACHEGLAHRPFGTSLFRNLRYWM